MGSEEARTEMFKDEAASQFDELKQVILDMESEGICYTEDLRRIADELDEIWNNISTKADVTEEEDLDVDSEIE
jgi:hypothetical protein